MIAPHIEGESPTDNIVETLRVEVSEKISNNENFRILEDCSFHHQNFNTFTFAISNYVSQSSHKAWPKLILQYHFLGEEQKYKLEAPRVLEIECVGVGRDESKSEDTASRG